MKATLITAIVVLLAAGGLLWLNLRHRHTEDSLEIESRNQRSPVLSFSSHSLYVCGWPFTAYRHEPGVDVKITDRHFSGSLISESPAKWFPVKFILDTLIACLFLLLTAVLCEWALSFVEGKP
jgi:hypothetical protein